MANYTPANPVACGAAWEWAHREQSKGPPDLHLPLRHHKTDLTLSFHHLLNRWHRAIFQAIETSRTSVESKLEELRAEFGLLHDDHRKLTDKVAETERILTEVQPQLQDQK